MFRYAPVAVAIILIGSLTYVQGVWSHRWSAAVAASQAKAERIEHVPMNIGDWEGTDEEVTEAVIRVSGAAGYLSRIYKHKETGDSVKIWLICGRPVAMYNHNPQICYPSQGYRQLGLRRTHVFETKTFVSDTVESASEFYMAVFQKESHLAVTSDRVYWAFAAGPKWQAPLSTRLTFHGEISLYKLYLTCQNTAGESNAATKFGQEFIPVVNEVLFRPVENEAADTEPQDGA